MGLIRTGAAKWIILLVENKSREFDSKIFLACLAAERGYTVLLCHYGAFRKWIRCLPRGMILEKSISTGKEKLLKRYRDAGYRISSIDEESFSIFVDSEKWLRTRVCGTTLDIVDYMFTWSERQAEMVRGKYPLQANKVLATGTQRADLWRKEMRALYDADVADIRKRYGRFILMPSNFTAAINVKGDDFTIIQAQKYGHIRHRADEQVLVDRIKHLKNNLEEYAIAFRKIRSKFPGHTLVIRPHPTDNHEYWEKVIASIDNVVVIHEGSPTPWLLAADAIFHHGCSTGLEARVLGRCSIAYHPCWDGRFNKHPSTMVGPVARDLAELITFLDRSIRNPDGCALKTGEVEDYISIEGDFACEKMLNALDKCAWAGNSLNLTLSNPNVVMVRIKEAWGKVRNNIRRLIGWKSHEYSSRQNRSRQKWPGASVDEVQSLILKYGNMLGRFRDVNSEELVENIFCISLSKGE